MTMKLGFALSSIGDNEIANNFINQANEFLTQRYDVDIIGFVNNQEKPKRYPTFGIMNINEMYDYDGAVIALDQSTAQKLSICPGPRKRFWYLWNLPWTPAKTVFSFEKTFAWFHQRNMILIAKDDIYKGLLNQTWGTNIQHIVSDFNIHQFLEVIRDVK